MKTLPSTTHQPREAEQDHKHTQQKTTGKKNQNKKRTRTMTDNQEPIRDKLFTVITNKVITMMKIKGVRALDELAGSNKGKIRLLSRADEKKKIQQRIAQRIKTQGRTSRHHTRTDN